MYLAIFIDGTAIGDGSPEANGMCQKQDATRNCLSTGECRACQFVVTSMDGTVVNRYEGCGGITSTEPICDADSSAANIQFGTSEYTAALTPICSKCTKTGNVTTSDIA